MKGKGTIMKKSTCSFFVALATVAFVAAAVYVATKDEKEEMEIEEAGE